MVTLSELSPPPGSRKKSRRVGRGPGSGRGKTSGRGHKGQLARSGGKSPAWREGGQMPLYRRLPKRGFTNIFRTEFQIVNLDELAQLEVTDVTPEVLCGAGLTRSGQKPIKILGRGEIQRALNVQAHAFARSAREKIVAAGGACEVLG